MKKTSKKTVRFTIGFNADDWPVVEKAIQARYDVKDVFAETSAQERCHFLKLAVCAVSSAMIRQKVSCYSVIACDIRAETDEEMELRLGKVWAERIRRYRDGLAAPDNIIDLWGHQEPAA